MGINTQPNVGIFPPGNKVCPGINYFYLLPNLGIFILVFPGMYFHTLKDAPWGLYFSIHPYCVYFLGAGGRRVVRP